MVSLSESSFWRQFASKFASRPRSRRRSFANGGLHSVQPLEMRLCLAPVDTSTIPSGSGGPGVQANDDFFNVPKSVSDDPPLELTFDVVDEILANDVPTNVSTPIFFFSVRVDPTNADPDLRTSFDLEDPSRIVTTKGFFQFLVGEGENALFDSGDPDVRLLDESIDEIYFTPFVGATGLAQIEYSAITGNNSSPSTAFIQVYINCPPMAVDDEVFTFKDQSVQFDPLANDEEPDPSEPPVNEISFVTIDLDTAELIGTDLYKTANGTFTFTQLVPLGPTAGLVPDVGLSSLASIMGGPIFTYTPDPGFVGIDSFVYFIEDNLGQTSSATVTIFVFGNAPPVGLPDEFNTNSGTPLVVLAPGVLLNDGDPHDFFPSTTQPSTLTVFLLNNPLNGTVNLNLDGSFVYTPNVGFAGTDTFTYRVFDNEFFSSPVTVTIHVFAGGNKALLSLTPAELGTGVFPPLPFIAIPSFFEGLDESQIRFDNAIAIEAPPDFAAFEMEFGGGMDDVAGPTIIDGSTVFTDIAAPPLKSLEEEPEDKVNKALVVPLASLARSQGDENVGVFKSMLEVYSQSAGASATDPQKPAFQPATGSAGGSAASGGTETGGDSASLATPDKAIAGQSPMPGSLVLPAMLLALLSRGWVRLSKMAGRQHDRCI